MEKLELAIAEIKAKLPGMELKENAAMAEHCSFKIGGPVRAMAYPENVENLVEICRILKAHDHAPYMLGNATNILFPDEGLKNVFIINSTKLDEMYLTEDGAICAQAGISLAKLASFAYQHSLEGLEFASGIPGSIGGGLMMNAGAYGGELKDVVESVSAYSLREQRIVELSNAECRLAYRTSLFQQEGGYVVLGAKFRLNKGDQAAIAAKSRELNEKRRDKQPLDLPSAGSAFKRPVGGFAAALIEQSGLKGFAIGGAQVSEKHAGFVVNRGGATAKDVRELMAHVKKTVFEKTGVELTPEMIMLPADLSLEEK